MRPGRRRRPICDGPGNHGLYHCLRIPRFRVFDDVYNKKTNTAGTGITPCPDNCSRWRPAGPLDTSHFYSDSTSNRRRRACPTLHGRHWRRVGHHLLGSRSTVQRQLDWSPTTLVEPGRSAFQPEPEIAISGSSIYGTSGRGLMIRAAPVRHSKRSNPIRVAPALFKMPWGGFPFDSANWNVWVLTNQSARNGADLITTPMDRISKSAEAFRLWKSI